MCPSSLLKVCWIHVAICTFSEFQISGTRKVSGKFPSEKSDFWKFHAKFCRNRLYLCAMQTEKTAKKRRFSEFGFRDFPTFSEISGFIPIYPNFTCVPCCAERVLKTPKMHKLFRISFKSGKIFPKFRAVFFSDGFLEFRISESDQFLRNLHSAKRHITLRFSEKKEPEFGGHFLWTSSPWKVSGKCRGMRHGKRMKTLPEFRVHGSAQRVLRKFPRIFRNYQNGFPGISVTPSQKKFGWFLNSKKKMDTPHRNYFRQTVEL
jgi:hypothetical protein